MYDILNVYLENGLQIVMHKIPYVKTMACGLWVKQGSKHEEEDTNGLSHLIEHLKINKENKANKELKKILDEIVCEGVKYNAATTKENTYFYFAGLADNLEKCINALQVIATNCVFDNEFFENEKKIVNQEISTFYSSFNQIRERTGQALWGNIGIGKIIVGKKENVNNASLDKIQNIISQSYNPGNSVIAVVGNIDYDKTLEIIQKYFSEWEDRECMPKNDLVNNEPGFFLNDKWAGENCIISVGFRTTGFKSSRRNNLEIISKIMGDNSLESRLCNEIRIKRGLAYTVGGFHNSYESRGNIGFAVICNNKSVDEVIKIMMNEFSKIRVQPFLSQEINRAKKICETRLLLDIEDIEAQLKYLGKSCCYQQVFSIENEIRSIKRVKKESLLNTVNEIFTPNNMSIALIGKVDIDNIIPLLNF